jgi:glutaredoxin
MTAALRRSQLKGGMASRFLKLPLALLALAAVLVAWPNGSGLPSVRSAEASGRASVTVFMTAWCRACQTLMRGLDREHVPYRAVDIEKDPKRYEAVRERLGRSTIPVTIVRRSGNEHWVVGANTREVVGAYRGE